jgi:phosphatidate cytidylyltransferase
LLIIVLGGLLLYPVAFVVIVSAFAVVGVWEVSRALLQRHIAVPLAPVMIGTIAMPAAAYFSGAEGLLFALVASAVAVLLWRSLDPTEGAIQSIFAGVFALAWIPFMISFVFLLLRADGPTTGITWLSRPHVGTLQVVIILMLVVANDTFGYLIGAFFGKHPMAPKISPKKSWEGFGGSVGGAVLVAVPAAIFLLGQSWWIGLVLAVGLVAAATAGDLAESMVKRELGVKDMSSILPGHGGVMDRLDSILFAAPTAFLIFSVLAPFQT